MFDPNTLRIAATVCSITGSILLAWRVKRILDALTLVASAHEVNIQQLMPSHAGDIYNFGNSTEHVELAKGTSLLVLGFSFLALSGALDLIALTI